MAKKNKCKKVITYKHANGKEYRIMSKDEVLDVVAETTYISKAFFEKVLESRIIFLKGLDNKAYMIVTPTELEQNFSYTVEGVQND